MTAPATSSQTGPQADPTLLFMHIAKTGGTSVRQALAAAYGKNERAFIYDPGDLRGAVRQDKFPDLPLETRDRLRLVLGHFQYGIHEHLGRPFRYVTVIRDPVDRVVSLYYHYRNLRGLRRGGPAFDEQARIIEAGMSLEDWVFGRDRLAVDNGMTRTLAARRGVPFGQCRDDLFDEAAEHIDQHFAALFTTDSLARSHAALEGISGRQLKQVPRKNVNKRRPPVEELDPAALDRIRDLNHLDVRLYELARANSVAP